ncbi:MAG: hypothetical protein HYZ07_00190 [Candidatus Harrisonbacteria bacterium]|nr:hypothetical protein [Candidatus Harrisonbacteria bacterium]MBI3114362.1 hypothetical protein [Candidatus Harrisonbacteria bacterium]
MKNAYIAIAIVIVAALAVGIWYFRSREAEPLPDTSNIAGEAAPSAQEELGGALYEATQNPVQEKLPETNPFKAQANPFGAEVNPFQDVYKNPFE